MSDARNWFFTALFSMGLLACNSTNRTPCTGDAETCGSLLDVGEVADGAGGLSDIEPMVEDTVFDTEPLRSDVESPDGREDTTLAADATISIDIVEVEDSIQSTDVAVVPDPGPPVPTECDDGSHLNDGTCVEWAFETIAENTIYGSKVTVGADGTVGAAWRVSNDPVWGIRKGPEDWSTWTTSINQVPMSLAFDASGKLWGLWKQTGSGNSYRLNHWPNPMSPPIEIENQGEDASMALAGNGQPGVAFVAGFYGDSLDYWEGPNGPAETLLADKSAASNAAVRMASNASGAMVLIFRESGQKSLQFWRRSATGPWSKVTTMATGLPILDPIDLAVSDDGVAHVTYRQDASIMYVGQVGQSTPKTGIVDDAAGAGDSLAIAVTPSGQVYIVDSDAEADLRLHSRDSQGAWHVETIVAERSKNASDVVAGPTGDLWVTFAYRYPSGDRELRLAHLPLAQP